MKTSEDIKKIVDKDMHIQVLRETLTDLRIENLFIKKVVLILFVMLAFAIAGIFFQSMWYQHRLFRFMQEYEVVSSVNMNNQDSYNAGSIMIERK